MPSATKRSGCSIGSSTTSRIRSICSLHPPAARKTNAGPCAHVADRQGAMTRTAASCRAVGRTTAHARTNIGVRHVRLLLHRHHRHRGVDLGRQRDLYLVLCAVHPAASESRYLANEQLVLLFVHCLLTAQCQTPREHCTMPHPTRMPSSMSVGATLSPSPTTNCAFTNRHLDAPPPHWATGGA